MRTRPSIAPLAIAFAATFGLVAVHAAPVVTQSNGGFQSAKASVITYGAGFGEAGGPSTLNAPRLYSTPAAEQIDSAPGSATVSTGVVGTYATGGAGGTPLPGVAAAVAVSGTRVFGGSPPTPWSAQGTAIASAQTGRMELSAAGIPYTQSSSGEHARMFSVAGSSAMIYSSFESIFSRDVAATLDSVPQYLTLTATLVGHTTAPGQAGGRLRIASDFRTMDNLQELVIDVQETGDWTQQYQLQFAFTDLYDIPGNGNCLQQPTKPWLPCLSLASMEASFALGSVAEGTSTLSVLLSWSVPDTVLSLRTNATDWGAPLALQLPVSAVPEPDSAAMLLLGLGVIAGLRSRRRALRRFGAQL